MADVRIMDGAVPRQGRDHHREPLETHRAGDQPVRTNRLLN